MKQWQTVVRDLDEIATTTGKRVKAVGNQTKNAIVGAGQQASTTAHDVVTQVGQKAREGKELAVQKGTEARDYAVHKGTEAKDYAVQKGTEAKEYAVQKGTEAKDYAIEKGTEAKEYAVQKGTEAKEYTVQKGTEAKDYAIEKGTEAKEYAEWKAYQAKEKGLDYADIGLTQVDKVVGPMKATETFKAKGGTRKGYEQAESMVTAEAEESAVQRIGELAKLLLRTDVRGGTQFRAGSVDLFNKVVPQLSGGRVLKEKFAKQGGSLDEALRKVFAPEHVNKLTADYLIDVLNNDGIPSPAMRIANACGLVTVPQSNSAVASEMVESLTPAELRTVHDTLATKLGGAKAVPAVVKSLHRAHEVGVKADKARGHSREQKTKDAWLNHWDKRVGDKLTKTYESSRNSFKRAAKMSTPTRQKARVKMLLEAVRKQALLVVQAEETAGHPMALRLHLARPGSQVRVALQANNDLDDQRRERIVYMLSSPDLDIDTKVPEVEDESAEEQAFTTPEEQAQQDKSERRESAEDTVAVNMVKAAIGQGTAPAGTEVKTFKVVKLVKAMTGEQRHRFVASYLTDTKERALYLNPGTPRGLAESLFRKAWEAMTPDLEATLLKEEDREKKKTDADVAALKSKMVMIGAMLRHGDLAGPNYMALVELSKDAFGTKVSTTSYGTRIWESVQRLEGAEFYQVRTDTPLLLRLRKLVKKDKATRKVSRTNWDKVVELLKLPAAMKIGSGELKVGPEQKAKDKAPKTKTKDDEDADAKEELTLAKLVVKDVAPEGVQVTAASTMGEVYEATADSIEFDPMYWAALLHKVVKPRAPLQGRLLPPSKSETYSVVKRIQNASRRWVTYEAARREEEGKATDKDDDKTKTPAPKQPAPTVNEFLTSVYNALRKEDQKNLKSEIPKAHDALVNGTPLEVETRLKRAEGWNLPVIGQTNIRTNVAGVVAAFEDLNGRELLEEWSNFPELRAKVQRQKELVKEMDKVSAKGSQDKKDADAFQALFSEGMSLEQDMGRWWPSIRRDRLDWLEANLSGKTLVDVQGLLAQKLAVSMRSDAEFVDAAQEAGLAADDYDAERVLFGHTMNKQRQLDTGLQYGAKNQMRALRTLGQAYMSPLGTAKFIQKGGDENLNKGASQARKEERNIYLAKVRNAQTDLSRVEQEKLSPEDKAAKLGHIRKQAAASIEETREALAERSKEFEKLRGNLEKAISRVLKILFAAAMTAAISAVTFGAGGVVLGVVTAILMGVAREVAGQAAKWAMYGDAFEKKDLAAAIIIGAVKGGLKAATGQFLFMADDLAFDEGGGLILDQASDAFAYGEMLKNAAIAGAMRGAVVEIPVTTLQYFMTTEKPFRNFGKNLDLFIANELAAVTAAQLRSLVGNVTAKGAMDLNALIAPPTTPASGSVVDQGVAMAHQQAAASVGMMLGYANRLAKLAKTALKAGIKKIYGKYPEQWKKLTNESELALAGLKEEEKKLAGQTVMPDEKEIDRVMKLIEQIDKGEKTVDDFSNEDKRVFGLLLRYAKGQGMSVP